jgi:hypothetical protein
MLKNLELFQASAGQWPDVASCIADIPVNVYIAGIQ